jgi:Flp pilus assembly protein TadG
MSKWNVKKFIQDRGGVIAIALALAMVPLLLATGAAVDYGRAYVVKSRLGYALDAAGLAVGSSNPTRADLQDVFQSYFAANFPEHELGTTSNLSMTVEGGIIKISASASVDTTFLKIISKNSIEVIASATIIRETTGLEMVLVMDNTGSMASFGRLAALKDSAHELIDILFGDQEVADRLYVGLVPFSGTVNIGAANWPDRDDFINDYSNRDFGPSTWFGCVEARRYPHDVQDTSARFGGKWNALYWADHNRFNNWIRSRGRYRINEPRFRGPNKECPQAVTPLTNVKDRLTPRINSMVAAGFTHVNYGAVWGWRLLSPDPPFSEGVPYGTEGWNKVVVILTDGANTASSSRYTAYGYLGEGRLGTRSSFSAARRLDDRLLDVCTNMKNLGIIVYTITFQLNSSSTQSLYRECASEASKYYNSPSIDELRVAFRAIGAELSNLRLAK